MLRRMDSPNLPLLHMKEVFSVWFFVVSLFHPHGIISAPNSFADGAPKEYWLVVGGFDPRLVPK